MNLFQNIPENSAGLYMVFMGILGLFGFVIALAITILIIYWICKYIMYFIKVPDQLSTIIKQLQAINNQLNTQQNELNELLTPKTESAQTDSPDIENVPEPNTSDKDSQ